MADISNVGVNIKGEITLIDAGGEYVPVKGQGNKPVPEKKDPLEKVIEKINLRYGGQFTEADKVIITTLLDKLVGDKKLAKNARTSDLQLFSESIFPKVFDEVAQESYLEQTEAFTSMFEQKAKYAAIMAALAEMLYKEFNKNS